MNEPEHPHVPVVPPGSTAQRELLYAVCDALAVPGPAYRTDEGACALLVRRRAHAVEEHTRRLADELEADDSDVMATVELIREATARLPVNYKTGTGYGAPE